MAEIRARRAGWVEVSEEKVREYAELLIKQTGLGNKKTEKQREAMLSRYIRGLLRERR